MTELFLTVLQMSLMAAGVEMCIRDRLSMAVSVLSWAWRPFSFVPENEEPRSVDSLIPTNRDSILRI